MKGVLGTGENSRLEKARKMLLKQENGKSYDEAPEDRSPEQSHFSEGVLVALDSSTRRTGYSVYYDGILMKSGCLVCDETNATIRRMHMMDKIDKLLSEERPEVICIELMCVRCNMASMRQLERIVGHVERYAFTHEIGYAELRPSEWRKAVCVEGEKVPQERAAAKAWSVAKVKEVYGIDCNDDEADAILIGMAYYTEK